MAQRLIHRVSFPEVPTGISQRRDWICVSSEPWVKTERKYSELTKSPYRVDEESPELIDMFQSRSRN